MPQIAQYIGGAGTGKTRHLLNTMEQVVERLHDPHIIGFCSFTRAACDEAADRAADRFNVSRADLRDRGWFRTIHGVAHRCLGIGAELLTDNAESAKWLREALQDDAGGSIEDPEAERLDVFEGASSEAQRALALWHAARNRLEPLRGVWEEAEVCDSRTPDYEQCRSIVERYEQAKRLDGRVDFVDLLAMFSGWNCTVDGAARARPLGEAPKLPVWIHDEMQDSSRLLDACFRRLIETDECQWVYLAGDPFQCQPAGTLVRTAGGEVPIESLDPNRDWIIAFSVKDGKFYGRGKQIRFEKASRVVDSSEVWEITTQDGRTLLATGNHRWYCRFRRHKRGEHYGSKLETCNIIPGITMIPRPLAFDDGRSDRKNGVYRPELRERRTVRGGIEWVPIESVRRLPPGMPITVYSLDVDRYHTYISDGFVTCNSIYGWAGGSPRCFSDGYPVAKRKIMPRSYRCPAEILSLGEELLSDCSDYWDRGIEPVGPGGEIDELPFCDGWADEIDPRESWLLLARTNYQAARMARRLDELSIPWLPTKKAQGGRWKAPVRNLAIKALMSIQAGAPIDGREWQAILKQIPARADGIELLVRGTKARFAAMEDREVADRWAWVPPEDLGELGATAALVDLVRSGRWQQLVDGADIYHAAVDRWGQEAVDEPRVRLGTVHSAKGAEADNVAILTTISEPCANATESDEGHNEEQRVKYVAVTRARKRLIVLSERNVRYRWRLTQ